MTREEAIKRLKEYAPFSYGIWHNDEEDTKAFDMAIEALQAKPKTGKWIIKYGSHCDVPIKEYYCDQCGKRGGLATMLFDDEPLPNYCSNCGADMRGNQE